MNKNIVTSAIIIFLLVFVAGAAKGVSDTLQFHYPQSVFKNLGNEKYWNPAISWKNKYKNYDQGDKREAFPGSRNLLVWLTDAWHLAQTIETLGWVLAMLVVLRMNDFRAPAKTGIIRLLGFGVFTGAAFYFGFVLTFSWLLLA